MNRLTNEKSPYLRHAAGQPVHWFPWGEEAFARARAENKPVFLSSGGVWCHWCHVMARETFSDREIASFLNEHFISIKIDRDELPAVDRRYQQAVALLGGAGGWPLSVFLTPGGAPFFGGTYFPPEDGFGRPGFKKVLRSVQEFFASRSDDAGEHGSRVLAALAADRPEPGDPDPAALDGAEAAMLELADREHGGFGGAPKFPMPGVLDFLLRRSAGGSASAAEAVRRTLDAMARGGIHDQLAGGFHRYSVDDGWHVPHFEKMADDNAWLLRNYLDAYGLFGEERFRSVAEGIIAFVRETLSDPGGGFFASQDADVTPDDEGGYFTWTDEELREVLAPEEHAALALRNLHERGLVRHRGRTKHVLCEARSLDAVAAELRVPAAVAADRLARAQAKLLMRRGERPAPFVDQTLYASLNGIFITAFFKGYRVLGNGDLKDLALRALERVLRELVQDDRVFHRAGVEGQLEDQVFVVEALVAAYEATAEQRYLDRAVSLMDACLARFEDRGGGGFFDTESELLGLRLKRIEDVPHPSGNGVAVLQLLRLFAITGREAYRAAADRALRCFAGSAPAMTVHAGAYYSGLHTRFHLLFLDVEAHPESDLARTARRITGPATAVRYGEERGRVVPCAGTVCGAPVSDAEELLRYATGKAPAMPPLHND